MIFFRSWSWKNYYVDTIKCNVTVGFEFSVKKFKFGEDRVQLDVWDTAGQDRFRSLIPSYYKRAAGALVVYDITNMETFKSIHSWMNEINDHADQDILKMVIGNKTDLEAERIVWETDGEELAKQYGSAFMETSALDGINMKEVFFTIAKEIYEYVKENEKQESFAISRNTYSRSTLVNQTDDKKKKSCGC